MAKKVGIAFAIFAVAVSFVISLAGSSLKSTVQVYFLDIADSFEVSRGTLAVATTLFAVTTAVASTVVGHLSDRIGAVPVLAIGAAVSGAVLLLSAAATNIWMFVLVYGVLGAVALTMLSYVPLGVLAAQLFHGRTSGVLYAVLTNGAAVGFVVLVPLWTRLDGSFSWPQVFAGVGVVFLLLLLPLSLLLVRVAGRRKPAGQPVVGTSLLSGFLVTVRDPRVRALALAFIGCGMTMAFIDIHLFPHMADHGVPASLGSLAVAVLGVLEIVGSLVAGRLCDIGRIRATLVGAYLLRASSMIVLLFVSTHQLVIVFGAMFGASYLATVVATTMWVNRILAPGVRGTVLGVLWAVHMMAVAVSSQAGAMLADLQHGYTTTIVATAAFAAGAALVVARQQDPDADTTEPPGPAAGFPTPAADPVSA